MSAAWDLETGHIGKSWYPNKTTAKAALRRHDHARCPKCLRGTYYWQAYVCHFGGTTHWHRGHKPVNGWRRIGEAS